MKNKVLKYILIGLTIVIVLSAWGLAMAILHDTFIPVWMPLTFAAVAALVLLPAMLPRMARLIPDMPRWVLGIAHIIIWGGIFMIISVGSNYMFASPDTAVAAHATVVAKTRKEHTRYRRAGRRHSVPAGKYHTWHLTLRLDDGRCHERSVSLQEYNRTRIGASRTVPLQRGLFGFTVVKPLPQPKDNI